MINTRRNSTFLNCRTSTLRSIEQNAEPNKCKACVENDTGYCNLDMLPAVEAMLLTIHDLYVNNTSDDSSQDMRVTLNRLARNPEHFEQVSVYLEKLDGEYEDDHDVI